MGYCGGGVLFRGFATWSQSGSSQSDATQDMLMDSACAAAYSGSHAANVRELIDGRILMLPPTNTTTQYLVPACPDCAGRAHAGCVDGHARNCVRPGAWLGLGGRGLWIFVPCINGSHGLC